MGDIPTHDDSDSNYFPTCFWTCCGESSSLGPYFSKHESHTLTSLSIPNLGSTHDLPLHLPQNTWINTVVAYAYSRMENQSLMFGAFKTYLQDNVKTYLSIKNNLLKYNWHHIKKSGHTCPQALQWCCRVKVENWTRHLQTSKEVYNHHLMVLDLNF